MTEHFASWKVKFDIDFDIKPIMTDEEKITDQKISWLINGIRAKNGIRRLYF